MYKLVMDSNTTLVAQQEEWNKVVKDLEGENLKLASYDNTLVPLLGDLTDKNVLDYGAGPGVLALGLKKLGAKIKVWDINPEMRKKASGKIGTENTYQNLEDIPRDHFDFIICNLVLCIVPESELRAIIGNLKELLNENGLSYIGFCNPKIFDIKESNLDFRFPTGNKYDDNHDYKKVKKEGGYEIIETHRPIEWYEKVFAESGLELVDTHFTPEYELEGEKIQDFVIFELRRKP